MNPPLRYQLFQLSGNWRKFVSSHESTKQAVDAAVEHHGGGDFRQVIKDATHEIELIPAGQTAPKYVVVDVRPNERRIVIRE